MVEHGLCKDCEGVVTVAQPAMDAPRGGDSVGDWDRDLICVVCGAALSLGGLLLGELAALADDTAAA